MPGFYDAPSADGGEEQQRNRIAQALMNVGNPPPRTPMPQAPQMSAAPQPMPMQQPQMPVQSAGAPMPQMPMQAPMPMQGGGAPPAGAGAPPMQGMAPPAGAGAPMGMPQQARPRY